MTDRRFHPANSHIALKSGTVDVSVPTTDGTLIRIASPVVDLCETPKGARDKQMLHGWSFRVLEMRDGWAFGVDPVDGYVGYLPQAAVTALPEATHRVCIRSGHIYSKPDIKAPETETLSFFSEVTVTGAEGDFLALEGGGFMARQHLAPLSWSAHDPADIAELFLGTPYLWGGNTGFGIDCSGLVQMAFYAADRSCPRDSDLQARIGTPVDSRTDLQRGDLVFWKGHVGMMLDRHRLIHANAHHMRVAVEPLDSAVERINAKEFGQVTGFRRF
ncbi:C40 family peptidase [Phaeobacter marinintestinus]|uniref:C40 family peptidase n=1 Tax=Falsiphaeobacter marinintestinus TaxID=1492905 RepID=UPI0011B83063|nr:C40 family peptidase [Phaeobacter marinintestinus]